MAYPDDDTCFYKESCLDLWWRLFGLYEYEIGSSVNEQSLNFPSVEDCSDLPGTLTALAYSVSNLSHVDYPQLSTESMAACRILCGESDPIALFLSLGASKPMAIGMCIFVVTLLVLASLYLISAILQHLTQWIPTLGSLAMGAGFPFFVVLYSESSYAATFNPQPVIAAMNAAIFSYFFSGFQYAISPGFEFGPAVSLLAVGYPLWLNLMYVPYEPDHPKAYPVLLARAGLAMPIVSLIWITHSALYRTIGYRAAWIRAWRLYQYAPADKPTPRKHMSSLWTLAAAQEQPTWRSVPGQSTGALLLIFAWIIVLKYDDACETVSILLLKAMIYLPPLLLTVATVWTQIMISFFESNSNVVESFILEYQSVRKAAATPTDTKASGQILSMIGSVLGSAWSKLEVPSRTDYTDSIIAYKLGRNMLYVEPNINIYRGVQDTIFGFSMWIIEIGLQILSMPICWVLLLARMCLRWVIATGIGCTLHFTRFENFKCAVQQLCDAKRIRMKLHACKILCKHCGEDSVVWTTVEENMMPLEVDDKVRDILSKHPTKINLNELLHSSRSIELLYLLSHLDDVLASTESPNIEQELELIDLEDLEDSNNSNDPILKRYATFS